MKNIFLTLSIILFGFISYAQDSDPQDQNQDEIKLNLTNFIIFSYGDIAYERLLNEESSFGVSLVFNVGINDDAELPDYGRKFSLTPYYRQYFSKSYAKGFFIEGFTMIHSGEDEVYNAVTFEYDSNESYTNVALGVSAGGKFITGNGFLAEVYLGVGRNLLNTDISSALVGRGGVSVGYRF